MKDETIVRTAKAKHGNYRVIVDDCPYCHKTHYHNYPLSGGQRMADCFQGEYVLDFGDNSLDKSKGNE